MSAETLRRAARISGPPIFIAWVLGVITGLFVYDGAFLKGLLFPPALFALAAFLFPIICYLAARGKDAKGNEQKPDSE
ncbi:hypothetical protein [Corynebacterium sp.]|uniref:hypothetical protein n=1 Tax=Corynebacterium sp. TaxID=1720 RepID=UPI0026DB4B46|nr:hypothetical protein [Corynebacterium sp.]MDO5077884.1 hypothetical protein [Corynebacterium sp.]